MKNLNLNLDKEFYKKKILVTGASRGLGYKTCELLASKGAQLVMMSRSILDLQKLKKKLKNSKIHTCLQVDFLKKNEIESSVNKLYKKFKNIDVVLHIAGGGYGLKDPLINNEDIKKLLQINLLGAVEINRLIVQKNKKNKNLKLVHVGSISSYEATGSVGYNTVKSALAAYVRSLGRELYKQNIIVTGILPGGFLAPGNAMDRLRSKNIKVFNNFIEKRLPRGFMGNVNEILPMLLFLCSSHASMMGGCMVPIDAGEGKSYLN